jgi:hypothetical protein
MLDLTARCIAEMGFTQPLHYVAELLSAGGGSPGARPIQAADVPGGVSLAGHLLANYNPLIFDFGLDQTGLNLGTVARVTDWPRELRYSLGAVARCLEDCAQESDALQSTRAQIPDFLVLNANHYVFQVFIAQFMLSTETPYPLHVRKGRPRVGEDRRYRGVVWKYNEDSMRAFFAYGEEDRTVPTVVPGDTIDLTSTGHSARYKDGNWGDMDYFGSWIEGYNAAIVFAPAADFAGDLVAYVRINEVFLGPEEEPMRLRVFFEGEFLTCWIAYSRYEPIVCKAVMPGRLIAGKKACRLEFHAENPQSAERIAKAAGKQLINEDPRELSVKIQRIDFTGADRLKYSLGDTLDFTEKGQGAFHTSERWARPDGFGVWTLGPDANLVLLLNEPVNSPLNANFTITDVAVSDDYPVLDVRVSINGRDVAEWILGPTRETDLRRILLPDGFPTLDPVHIAFHIKEPRSSTR